MRNNYEGHMTLFDSFHTFASTGLREVISRASEVASHLLIPRYDSHLHIPRFGVVIMGLLS